MGMFPGEQPSCLQLSRRFTKDERGERKKKAADGVADRGRESRERKGEGAGVKNVSRAR